MNPLVVLARENLPKPGAAQVTTFGTGFSVHPDGIVVTCWHTIENFYRYWSPLLLSELSRGQSTPQVDLERHEMLFFMFLCPFGPPDELQTLPICSLVRHEEKDWALVELGGRGRYRPLPAYDVCYDNPVVGEEVSYLGLVHPLSVPRDPDGLTPAFSIVRGDTTIVHVDETYIYLELAVDHGSSGAPVFYQGQVIGMAVEVLPPPLSRDLTGVRQSLTRVVRISEVLKGYPHLKSGAANREANGGIPWCSLPPERRSSYELG